MSRAPWLFFCLVLAATFCLGETISLTGNFDALGLSPQWDPFLAVFTTDASSNVVIQSFGFAGGTNAQGQVIPAGGFDPIVSLFQGVGPGAVFVDLNDDACPALDIDACRDSRLELPALPAGVYTVAVTAYANYPWAWWAPDSDPTLGDGFIGLGFIATSTTDFAVDITSDALVAIPEPAAALLLGSALLLTVFRLRWGR